MEEEEEEEEEKEEEEEYTEPNVSTLYPHTPFLRSALLLSPLLQLGKDSSFQNLFLSRNWPVVLIPSK